jgi:methylated-DNA-[protein]-cysteine S-methyltransferase
MLTTTMTQSAIMTPIDERLWGIISSPVGYVMVIASDIGVQRIDFIADDVAGGLMRKRSSNVKSHKYVEAAMVQLAEYFNGTREQFSLPLDLVGTDFQIAAWRALGTIPYGETKTYGEQAASIGRERAVRAIGSANSKNPVAIVLPCHRVIGADGSLTGYAGGMDKKKWLLEHEQRE